MGHKTIFQGVAQSGQMHPTGWIKDM